ncbi:helix-turn-helix transcriptional regulator [Brevibacillus fortis]|uniref:helix-turn-helix domain-containing protein n=1 Tax=Brevibacillus fortis TaxID=2126352 RepID=UPI002E21D9A6|nr:helix-turn-helix transcriptional regulator [Brevibacillus fortis]
MGEDTIVRRSLRSEIQKNVKENGFTLSKLSELSSISTGHLSEMLNSNPPRAITVNQLDAMATAFGFAPGWLYELYPEECLSEGKISRPRLVPYLVRCAEIGQKDCIEAAVSKLLENPKYISILFAVAEQLFESKKWKESVPFYESVIDNEKDSHSHQFVISHYRLFRAVQGTNSEENWKAVIRFESYRKRLMENHQLNALLQLANVCYTLRRWKDVEKYADELRELATIVYEDELRKRNSSKSSESFKAERHLVVYYGQGFLLKAEALKRQGFYKAAKQYVQGYSDLGWFEIMDETGQREVEKFRVWAKINSYTLELLIGNLEVLSECISFLDAHPAEVFPALVTIMECANKHRFDVDEILERFSEYFSYTDDNLNNFSVSQHFRFRYQKAIYEYQRERFVNGLDETLRCLALADKMSNHQAFKQCISLFENNRKCASRSQMITYHTIIEGGTQSNESSGTLINSDVGIV